MIEFLGSRADGGDLQPSEPGLGTLLCFNLLAATAEERRMNGATFISTESHRLSSSISFGSIRSASKITSPYPDTGFIRRYYQEICANFNPVIRSASGNGRKPVGGESDGLVLLKVRSCVTFDPSWLDSVDVNAMPVQVVGWQNEGVWNYPNLAAARKQFPELDPYNSTTRFTAAMLGEVDKGLALRFETWAAYEGYSM